ncbi:MAG TPA: hypothetical protein PKA06_08305, partial [Gemmatales bacterium]|nr:hypothetical protein [Gemmatales bacterium]
MTNKRTSASRTKNAAQGRATPARSNGSEAPKKKPATTAARSKVAAKPATKVSKKVAKPAPSAAPRLRAAKRDTSLEDIAVG